MKQALFILLFIVQGMIQQGISQTSKPIVPDNVKILNLGNVYLNSVNSRAIRDFLSKYENATGVAWYAVDKGFIVRFLIDSVSARSAYKKNGNWVYTIKQYMEEKMSKQVRHLVKSNYYDYAITLVEEIEQPDEGIKYIVHLQDNVSWKNVLVSNGQLEVIEDKKKL
jgi:hypothetical protein